MRAHLASFVGAINTNPTESGLHSNGQRDYLDILLGFPGC
jgi:hypothetical protein